MKHCIYALSAIGSTVLNLYAFALCEPFELPDDNAAGVKTGARGPDKVGALGALS